jgi:hypothetical protein
MLLLLLIGFAYLLAVGAVVWFLFMLAMVPVALLMAAAEVVWTHPWLLLPAAWVLLQARYWYTRPRRRSPSLRDSIA